MHITGRVALGVASVAVTGYGAKKFTDWANADVEQDHAKLQQATAASQQQWDTWKAKLDQAFPGGSLPTPEAHQRFEQFLKDSPPPKFVQVEHEEFTRVRLSAGEVVDRDLMPVEFEKSNGYPLAFGGMSALMGVGLLAAGIRGTARSTGGTIGMIAGGAAAAALGASMFASGWHGFKVGEGTEGVTKLRAEINSY